MEKLQKILTVLQLDNIYINFVKQRVSLEDISELSDDDLNALGVETIGNKRRLRKLCRSSLIGDTCIERGESSDQTSPKTIVPSEERRNIQPTQTSWNIEESSTMVLPENAGNNPYSYDRGGAASGPDIVMARGARVDIGDRGNVSDIGDRLDAEEIEHIRTTIGPDSDQPPSNSQSYLPDNTRMRLGEGATFDIGNRNNVVRKGSQITVKKVGTYESRVG